MRIVSVIIVTVILGLASAATAQHIPCEEGPCVGRKRHRPTHFIAELSGGSEFSGDSAGLAGAALIGFGGRLGRTPFRWYLISEALVAGYDARFSVPQRNIDISSRRRLFDLMGGLRLYIPFGPIRPFIEGLGGVTHDSLNATQGTKQELSASAWRGSYAAGAGVQVRVIHRLSVGVRARLSWNNPVTLYADGAELGPTKSMRHSAWLSLTAHF